MERGRERALLLSLPLLSSMELEIPLEGRLSHSLGKLALTLRGGESTLVLLFARGEYGEHAHEAAPTLAGGWASGGAWRLAPSPDPTLLRLVEAGGSEVLLEAAEGEGRRNPDWRPPPLALRCWAHGGEGLPALRGSVRVRAPLLPLL
jgi:hypothetical protein